MKQGAELARRRFLGALGVGTLGALGIQRKAHASPDNAPSSDAQRPLRFVGVYAPHGCAYEHWKPEPGFNISSPDCTLSPFDSPQEFGKSYRDQVLVIDGLDLAAGIEVGTVGHDASRVILTGSGVTGKNPSIDQFLASDQMLGAETPFTSLALAVGNDSTDLGTNISYAAGGTPVPKWIDPVQVFDELFGAPLSRKSKQRVRAERARKRSVLDFVRGDLGRLQRRAGAAGKIAIEQHQTALREIEKRLSPLERQCEAPDRPTRAELPRVEAFGGGEPFFETITNLQIDLLARALSCDLTRFATLMLADLTRTTLYPGYPDDVHQLVAHPYQSRTADRPGKPETWRQLAIQNRHSYKQVARLMQRLDEGGVLNDSLLLVQSDMGDPSLHSSRNVPTVLAGGAGGKFTMGRYIDFRRAKGTELMPNNRLLVSICQAFGVPVQRYGHSTNASTLNGTLDGLI